jgi:hypothetical protein
MREGGVGGGKKENGPRDRFARLKLFNKLYDWTVSFISMGLVKSSFRSKANQSKLLHFPSEVVSAP